MPKHLIDLYQASKKEKEKKSETNFVDLFNDDDGNPNVPPFDVSDFFAHPKEKINHMIIDGEIVKE